jgi:hypothetical protein
MNRVSNPLPNQKKFWELTDDLPPDILELAQAARTGIGGGKVVRLLEGLKAHWRKMFSDQEKEDLIRALDEYLDMIYDEYHEAETAEREYIQRIAVLFYVFTGEDWQSASGISFTKEGSKIEM